MRVKTNIGALVAGTILIGALTFVATGNGAPPTPAELQYHQAVAAGAHPTPPDSMHLVPPGAKADTFVLQALRGGLVYVALFVAMHLGLRRGRIGRRWAYAGVGALASLLAVSGATPGPAWAIMLARGNLSFYLAFIAVFGAVCGFLYRWRAGLEGEGDDPARLQEMVDARREAGATASVGDDALVDTGEAEYFDGPLQVRTSLPLAFVAALLSTGILALILVLAGGYADLMVSMPERKGWPLAQMISVSLGNQMVALLMALTAVIPFTVLILIAHMAARGLGKSSTRAYAALGAAAAPIVGLAGFVVGFMVGLAASIPMAVAMVLYRSMAGLEPKPVKEDVILNDRRNLVGEQHARRQFGRLIKG